MVCVTRPTYPLFILWWWINSQRLDDVRINSNIRPLTSDQTIMVPPSMPQCVSVQKYVDAPSTQQAEGICLTKQGWRSAWLQRRTSWPYEFLPRACQSIWPAIDKERKFISNLRWNMPVLPRQFQVCRFIAARRENQLNSRYEKKSAVKDCDVCGSLLILW